MSKDVRRLASVRYNPTEPEDPEKRLTNEQFFSRGNVEQLNYLRNQFVSSQQRRNAERSGQAPMTGAERSSHYKEILSKLQMKNKPMGLDERNPQRVLSLGPFLEAVQQDQIVEASAALLGRRPRDLRDSLLLARTVAARGAEDAEAEAKKREEPRSLKPATDDDDSKGAQATAEPPRLYKDPRTTKASSSFVHTSYLKRTLSQMHERQQRGATLSKALEECFQSVRGVLARRKSAPPLVSNIRVLREGYDEVDKFKRENKELKVIIDGTVPRRQEVELEAKNKELQQQITNQVALIKGLREKLRAAQSNPAAVLSPRREESTALPAPISAQVQPGEKATIVFVNVQSANFLRESLPHIIASQFELYHEVLRAQAAVREGYEVGHREESFEFAFRTPMAACQWTVDVQQALLNVDWHRDLCEMPDTPTEMLRGSASEFLWRGLRVQIGVETGALTRKDELMSKLLFEGAAVGIAHYLQQLALGGEILISEAVHKSIASEASSLGVVQSWEALALHPSKIAVFRLVPHRLKDRLRHFQRDFLPCEQLVWDTHIHSQHEAPARRGVTLVTVIMWNTQALEQAEEAMQEQICGLFRHCVETEVKRFGGYMSRNEGTRFSVAFAVPLNALSFALKMQTALLVCKWPDEIKSFFDTVMIQQGTIFHGARAQIGIHRMWNVVDVVDPLTQITVYHGSDAMTSTILALAAPCGTVLVSPPVLDEVSKNTEELHHPIILAAQEVSVPALDLLLPTFQLFPASLEARSSFVNSDLKVESAHSETVATLEKQIATLQGRLADKEVVNKTLQDQVMEKTNVISQVRRDVLGRTDKTIHVWKELREFDKVITPAVRNCPYILALSFAHATRLFADWPDETARALEIFDDFLRTELSVHHGNELRRTASGAVRLYAFLTVEQAASFWLSVIRNSLELPWPQKLEDSEFAGLITASEKFPEIGADNDFPLWRGLRPIAAIDLGLPTFNPNVVTGSLDAVGPPVNFVSAMLRQAAEGDCILSPWFAEELKSNLPPAAVLEEYGNFYRLIARDMMWRNKVLRKSFPLEAIELNPDSRTETVLVVHICIHNTKLLSKTKEYESDVALFGDTVVKLAQECGGEVIASSISDFCLGFFDLLKGVEYALSIHTRLLSVPWSLEALRAAEFQEVLYNHKPYLKGIRAHVGVHIVEDLTVTVDFFSGLDIWIHPQLPVAMVLAREAHAGETLLTTVVEKYAMKLQGGKQQKLMLDYVGSIVLEEGILPTSLCQIVPLALKPRIGLWLEEDRLHSDPIAEAKREAEKRQAHRTRKRMAQTLDVDGKVMAEVPSNPNPTDDPVPVKHTKLYARAKELLDSDYEKFRTVEATLSVIETARMVTEDPLYASTLRKQAEGKYEEPSFTHLLLHQLENGTACKSHVFVRGYAADIISGSKPLLGTPSATEGPLGGKKRSMGDRRKSTTVHGGSSGQHVILPEDVIQLHIAVESFASILALHGVSDLSVEKWINAMYSSTVEEGHEETPLGKLREMAAHTTMMGADMDSIHMETLRKSVVANLSSALRHLWLSSK